ncbi:DNA polymerase III subunit gamma/tau, partial [Lactobacillus iners]|nr:DNA polymerase III subunit gamma/tau [Lactobacillus iners]
VSSIVVQKLKNEIDNLSKQVAELKNRPVQVTNRSSSDFSGTIKTETNSRPKQIAAQTANTDQKPKRRKASANNQAAQEN